PGESRQKSHKCVTTGLPPPRFCVRYDDDTVANIYEVARRAGVSTAPLPRVLSQPSVVSPDTRRKVMQAVEFLDYEPNSAAKNLRTLRTGKLLVTVPDISNPFFAL